MKMSICLLVILFGVAAAAKPAPRYGLSKPVATYKARPVETYRPQAYHPVVYQIAPHHGGKFAKTGGKFAKIAAKIGTYEKSEIFHPWCKSRSREGCTSWMGVE